MVQKDLFKNHLYFDIFERTCLKEKPSETITKKKYESDSINLRYKITFDRLICH